MLVKSSLVDILNGLRIAKIENTLHTVFVYVRNDRKGQVHGGSGHQQNNLDQSAVVYRIFGGSLGANVRRNAQSARKSERSLPELSYSKCVEADPRRPGI